MPLPFRDFGLSQTTFRVLLIGLFMRFALSPSLLYQMHIVYGDTGGNPLTKIHPGTYVIALAVLLWLGEGGEFLRRLARHYYREPGLFAFTTLTLVILVYCVANKLSGTFSAFIDTFLAAALASSLLVNASVRQRDLLGRLLLWFLCINAAIAIGETLLQQSLLPDLPANAGGADLTEQITQSTDYLQQFRGQGLYGSSLEGATVTAMGIFLLFRLRLPTRAFLWRFGLLLIGLISFGGRAATVVTGVVLSIAGATYVVRGLLHRRLRAEALGLALIIAVVLPFALIYLINDTPLGTRLAHEFYYEDSAQTRVIDWNILYILPASNFLFGADADVVSRLLYAIGALELENCWLALFVSLGLVGFVVMLVGLVAFFANLVRHMMRERRESALWGAILILAFLVMITGFNSIGRKVALLLYLAAMMHAASPAGSWRGALRRRRHASRGVHQRRADLDKLERSRPGGVLRYRRIR